MIEAGSVIGVTNVSRIEAVVDHRRVTGEILSTIVLQLGTSAPLLDTVRHDDNIRIAHPHVLGRSVESLLTYRKSTSCIRTEAVLPRKANMEVVLALEDSEMLELTRGTSLDALFVLESNELLRRVQEAKDQLNTKTTRA
jgi:hypothetical protein